MAPANRPAETTEALRASLIDHARRIVSRDGPSALTMRALANEAS
jgi:DNA-binding transcriptional regulator YbjK